MIESGRLLKRTFGGCLTARTDAHQIFCKLPARYGHPCRIRIAFGFGFSDFSLSVPIDFREKIFVTPKSCVKSCGRFHFPPYFTALSEVFGGLTLTDPYDMLRSECGDRREMSESPLATLV
jgi:hypothetical protein